MWATNATARTSPAASTGQVRDGGHPGASVSAVHTSPTAPSASTAPTPSMRQPDRRPPSPPGTVPRRGRTATPAARAARMTGTLMRKIQRQLAPTSSPPSTGPPPAATPPTPAHIPTAVPRCRGGNTDSASPREVGISTAAPAACSARQAISAGSPGATAHPSDATPNTTSPARKNSRRPMPSAARPAGSSSVASTMAYTSRIHETPDSVAGAKSCCSAGSAMLTTHRSRTVRNWAADTTASTAHRRRPVSGCPASSSSGAVSPAAVVMSSTFGRVV